MGPFSRGCCNHLSRLIKDNPRLSIQAQPVSLRHPQPSCHAFPKSQRSFASKSKAMPPAAKARKLASIRPPPLAHQSHELVPEGFSVPRSAFARAIAQKSSPTLLYSNVGNADFTAIIAAIAGGYCIAYGGMWIYDACFVRHPGLWRPINYMNGVGGLVIVGVGLSIWTRMRGQVGKIQAVPMARGTGLMLRVEGRNWMNVPAFWKKKAEQVPLWPQTVVECAIHEVEMTDRILAVKAANTPLTAEERQKAKEDLLAQDTTGGKFLLAPLKRGFLKFRSMFLKVLIGEGYVSLRIRGNRYRMDVKSGWLLDDGHALDRLLLNGSQ